MAEFVSGKQQLYLEKWKRYGRTSASAWNWRWRHIQCTADVWPLTATLTKRLNAAHHRWQRSILGISWRDRVTNEEVREPELGNTAWMIYSAKEDYAGLGMWYAWTNSAYMYLNRRCVEGFPGSREVQVVCVSTGGAQSTRTCQGWDSPGRKQRWQL